eukprot:m.12122 g.12122  ORF g.12122 m.12122 type:complete len:76 (-) comp4589_c0_seq2:45-272(-)
MVNIETWDEFAAQAESLFQAEPERTRYSIKYRHSDGKVVLKVTDDKACLKFVTDQMQDLKKIISFNTMLCSQFTS